MITKIKTIGTKFHFSFVYINYNLQETANSSSLLNKRQQEGRQRSLQEEYLTSPHPHPFNRNKRHVEQYNAKTLTARSVLLEMSDEIEEDEFEGAVETAGGQPALGDCGTELERKFENFMKWVNQAKQDYVAMETVNSFDEFPVFFKVLERYISPTLLQIKSNAVDDTWTLVCQPLEDFKKEYMVLRIGLKYCLCLEPF